MENFVFCNPVKILFGKGQIANIAAEIPDNAKILINYGGVASKLTASINQVKSALANIGYSQCLVLYSVLKKLDLQATIMID
ncbi:hypothetical protein [Nostoc sp.]|uniref:hypothetical protein n=1 Tax=Nostoc sp. TaxID=1180 RepID=UPI003FA5B56F